MAPWEALLRECCESVINTMENATCRIPPIPLETLVVLAWLFKLLGRRFGATVMSPHGARTGGAKRQSAGCVRFCSRNPKRRLGGAKTVKYKRAADSASGTNAGRAGGAWCQNPGEFWDGGLALQSCHLMVPELEQPSARPARSAGRKNQSIFILFCQKWKIGSGRDLGSDLVSAEGGSYRGPTPKRKHP